MFPIHRTYTALATGVTRLAARAHAHQLIRSERGSATAEYAIAALAAAAFAALLIAVVSSPEIRKLLTGIISKALNTK
ncbi:Protein of unknown function [Bowdeniella nasicola]|uniref:DUF4244 domain-containing protein n=1 Tax=Bowdeniella nasicola TaxID=208480 RepID=A0A1H3WWD0_9ACTO|nr:DUF4244 domain-containing protein [Bowdeniella nasicola]SDZ91439.1 Protein of unknown function [Bowdeniella nasicola]